MYHKQPLTKREQEITKLIKTGMEYKEISEHLYISIGTIKTHVANILEKTGYKNRLELMSYYQPLFPCVKSWNSDRINKRFTTN